MTDILNQDGYKLFLANVEKFRNQLKSPDIVKNHFLVISFINPAKPMEIDDYLVPRELFQSYVKMVDSYIENIMNSLSGNNFEENGLEESKLISIFADFNKKLGGLVGGTVSHQDSQGVILGVSTTSKADELTKSVDIVNKAAPTQASCIISGIFKKAALVQNKKMAYQEASIIVGYINAFDENSLFAAAEAKEYSARPKGKLKREMPRMGSLGGDLYFMPGYKVLDKINFDLMVMYLTMPQNKNIQKFSEALLKAFNKNYNQATANSAESFEDKFYKDFEIALKDKIGFASLRTFYAKKQEIEKELRNTIGLSSGRSLS